ncbi:MAG TPA: hypothetical protein VFE42_21890 [Chloroflexota bacterium]|nr:hypothetical protein [Chloroflexota bacterium]
MPNETLIAAIDSVREIYSQKQRAATNLQKALKGATGALTKAGRALNEYAGQNGAVDGARLAQAQDAFADPRLKDGAVAPLLPELRREIKALSGTVTALRDAQAALRGEAVDAVRLGHAYKVLRESKLEDDEIEALLGDIDRELQEAQRTLGATFGHALRGALAEQGITVRGQPPRFEIGRFEIEADFVGRHATISHGKNLVARRVPLSVDAVIRAYQREARAIEGRKEDGERWIEQFFNAWTIARQKRDKADLRANIVDCYYEMVFMRQGRNFHSEPLKSIFVDYRRAQFAHDFYEFAEVQRRSYKGQRVFAHGATKSQTDSADKSIWICEGADPHTGRYIADVVFSKDE